ncbi:MAG: M23 family metallopeptidase [Actinobacteria bacterium]|nr:M23 family metallopeptidase [Actinomycetota bacterium]
MRGVGRIERVLAAVIGALLLVSGAVAISDVRVSGASGSVRRAPGSTTTVSTPPPRGPVATAPAAATAPAPPVATTPPPPPAPLRTRTVHEQPWLPYAAAGDVVLHHPSAQVEKIGFHESNHDGAREQFPLSTAVDPVLLESRNRGTPGTTAADVVAHPEIEVRSPVTGTVKRGGSYVLYCDNRDYYVVIEPDARPGWEVKVLHIAGLHVSKGDRVVAGETVIAPFPTQLPFESQVDEVTGQPAWPHVHIEVVDPSIPDRPNPGGGGGCT